jgi:hypothetical protein
MRRTLRSSVLISVVMVVCLTVVETSVLAKKRKKKRNARTHAAKIVVQAPPVVLRPVVLLGAEITPTTSVDAKAVYWVNEFGIGAPERPPTENGKFKVPVPGAAVAPPSVHISEVRWRGPAGAEDEFIEIYNNSDAPLAVQASDTSGGWTLAISNGQITGPVVTIPNGTVIPARGHLLCANENGYSLSNYPSGNPNVITGPTNSNAGTPNFVAGPFAQTIPDRTWGFDVPDGSGVALFSTTNGTNISAATRLDAFGFTNSPALYKEGAGFPTVVNANSEHTYYRDLRASIPKDTNDNAADFKLVSTSANLQVNLLGAPGPENLNSPIVNNVTLGFSLLDPSVAPSLVPNRERRPNVEANANLGILLFRRTVTNNTGAPVSRLRFRVLDITTRGTPSNSCGGSPCADLRLLTSQDGEAYTGGEDVTVRGLQLEESHTGPATADGGGLNSSVSADFITLQTPLPAGQSVNIEFKLGVMRTGAFKFYINIEALNSPPIIPCAIRIKTGC